MFSPYAIMLSLWLLCSRNITCNDDLSTISFIPISNLTTDFKKISSIISGKRLALREDDDNLLPFQQVVAFEWPLSPADMAGLNQQCKPASFDELPNIKSNIEKHHGHHKKMFIPGHTPIINKLTKVYSLYSSRHSHIIEPPTSQDLPGKISFSTQILFI